MRNMQQNKLVIAIIFSMIIEEIKTVFLGLCLTLWEIIKRIYHYSGFAHVSRKFIIVNNDDKKYPTGPLWAIGLYFAIYQVAVLNYQGSVAPLNRKVDQISTGVDQGDHKYWLRLLPKVQLTKTFKKPNILNPMSTIKSILGAEIPNPEIIQALKEVVESLGGNGKLREANLVMAKLFGAVLRRADFSGANLLMADLRDAKLGDADLSDANLVMAKLFGAVLIRANLTGADFAKADLRSVNLKEAKFFRTNLRAANLEGAKLLTCHQIKSASINNYTKLPSYMKVTWAEDWTYTCEMVGDSD